LEILVSLRSKSDLYRRIPNEFIRRNDASKKTIATILYRIGR
jgi:hypothetical protein